MDAIDPHVDEITVTEVALTKGLVLVVPDGREPSDVRRRQTCGVVSEQDRQCFTKVARRKPPQVQHRNHPSDLGRTTHVGRQDLAAEFGLVAVLCPALVMNAGRLHFDRPGHGAHLASLALAVAHDQAATLLIALLMGFDVLGELHLEGRAQHPPCPLEDQVVQGQAFFVSGSIVLDYAQHWVAYLPPMAPTTGLRVVFHAEG